MIKISFFILLCPLILWAAQVPRQIPAGRSNLGYHALGDACYTIQVAQEGLPCNPAFLTTKTESYLSGQIFLGNNVEYAKDAQMVVDNEGTDRNVENLFKQDRDAEFEADFEAAIVKNKIGFGFSPSRVTYYSRIRNRVLPYLNLYLAQEQIVRTQFATLIDDEFHVGLQVRGVTRRFVLTDFYLPELAAENGSEDLLEVRHQQALYLEPGIVWTPQDVAWSPKFSLMISQWGFVDTAYEGLPTSPEGQVGTSLRPPSDFGEIELGAHLVLHKEFEDWRELLRWAGAFQRGRAQLSGSFTDTQVAVGASYNFKKFNLGLVLDLKRIENFVGEDEQVRTVYLDLGAQI